MRRVPDEAELHLYRGCRICHKQDDYAPRQLGQLLLAQAVFEHTRSSRVVERSRVNSSCCLGNSV